jgi:hypothetical protein
MHRIPAAVAESDPVHRVLQRDADGGRDAEPRRRGGPRERARPWSVGAVGEQGVGRASSSSRLGCSARLLHVTTRSCVLQRPGNGTCLGLAFARAQTRGERSSARLTKQSVTPPAPARSFDQVVRQQTEKHGHRGIHAQHEDPGGERRLNKARRPHQPIEDLLREGVRHVQRVGDLTEVQQERNHQYFRLAAPRHARANTSPCIATSNTARGQTPGR